MRPPSIPLRAILPAALAAASCAHQAPAPTAEPSVEIAAAIVVAPDRTEADRALDPGRHPLEMLTFLNIVPGSHVAEIGAGGGYTTELLVRAVGSGGVVYAQNSPFVLQRFAEKPWSERLQRPVMKDVVRVDRDFDDPLPPEARQLDQVVSAVIYHDTVWMKVDRARMNRAIFEALKPGGIYTVIDNSARPGSGLSDVQTVHRIEEKTLIAEVTQAGFKLVGEGNFLRNPADTRDWNDSPREAGARRGTGDRFALRFQKP
jgi:predicted methyltransferase